LAEYKVPKYILINLTNFSFVPLTSEKTKNDTGDIHNCGCFISLIITMDVLPRILVRVLFTKVSKYCE